MRWQLCIPMILGLALAGMVYAEEGDGAENGRRRTAGQDREWDRGKAAQVRDIGARDADLRR